MNLDPKEPVDPNGTSDVESLVLDLNFVPAWARQPPAADPYHRHEPRPERRDADRSRQRPDQGRGRDRRPPAGRDRGGKPRGDARFEQRGDPRRDRSGPPPREPHVERLPFQVTFIPEQTRLAAMVADIRTSQHAYPLPELAHSFLNHPEWHHVKFEANKVAGGHYAAKLYQSKLSGLVFVDREECLKAVIGDAMSATFDVETIRIDSPSGNFVCVARCRLSGALLGPPNHHGYNQRVDELHRTRFSHMTLDEYRRNIETVRDAELIEKWKEECSTRTVYRLKDGAAEAEPLDYKAARVYVEEKIAPKQVASVSRVVLSGTASRAIREPRVLQLLRAAWAREQRFPLTLVRALRSAFRHMGLHIFNTKGGDGFVTAIPPKPIDPAGVVQAIREIMEWLKTHPGCSRQELINGVRPWAGEDPAKITVVLQPLTWLIEKGHVLEFYNGKLAMPKDRV